MRSLILSIVTLIGTSLSHAEDKVAIEGYGDWGVEVSGVSCRLTPNKTDYVVGETVYVLVEVKNNTDKPVALGLEPLIAIKNRNDSSLARQPAQLHMTFSQEGTQGNLGFFATYHITFPSGINSEAKSVVLKPKETFREVVQVMPWGPTPSSIPSTAQAGKMKLTGSLWQFLSPDLKKVEVPAKEIIFSVKSKK
ncbi:hypothetical protein P4C99_21010 [Pontiellaceae bacterium B1224]|nr:hypothetical protein [Pontiellaceae bacterium B1224]